MATVELIGPRGLMVVEEEQVSRYEARGYKRISAEKPAPVAKKKTVKKDS